MIYGSKNFFHFYQDSTGCLIWSEELLLANGCVKNNIKNSVWSLWCHSQTDSVIAVYPEMLGYTEHQKHQWAWLPQTRPASRHPLALAKDAIRFLQRFGGYQEAHWVDEGWVCPALDWTRRKAVNRSHTGTNTCPVGVPWTGESQSVGGVLRSGDWGSQWGIHHTGQEQHLVFAVRDLVLHTSPWWRDSIQWILHSALQTTAGQCRDPSDPYSIPCSSSFRPLMHFS